MGKVMTRETLCPKSCARVEFLQQLVNPIGRLVLWPPLLLSCKLRWLAFQLLHLFIASLYRYAASMQESPDARVNEQHASKGHVENQSLDSRCTAFINREPDPTNADGVS